MENPTTINAAAHFSLLSGSQLSLLFIFVVDLVFLFFVVDLVFLFFVFLDLGILTPPILFYEYIHIIIGLPFLTHLKHLWLVKVDESYIKSSTEPFDDQMEINEAKVKKWLQLFNLTFT
jgi:hypothetical protein